MIEQSHFQPLFIVPLPGIGVGFIVHGVPRVGRTSVLVPNNWTGIVLFKYRLHSQGVIQHAP
jgi:hypothetical protein